MVKTLTLKTWNYPIYIIVIILIQFALMFHGFDICDEGFSLTFYQQFFSYPESVEYCFVYWLSGLVGGLWYRLFETGGVFWFRILTIIFNTATLMLCYQMLKNFIKPHYVMLGLAMVLFVNDFGFLAFYHNHITAFLAVLSAYYLVKGIQSNSWVLLGLSGLILGVNIFSRLPNITLLIFVLAIPYANFILRKEPLIKSIKPMLIMILGSVLGVFLTILLIFGLNQWEIMEKALEVLLTLGKTDDSGHNIMSLIKVIRYNYVAVLFEIGKLFLIISILLVIFKFLKHSVIGKLVVSSILLLSFFVLIAYGDIYIVYAMGLVGCAGVILIKQQTEIIKVMAFIALLIMVFLPLGSGGGIHSSGYICIWLAIPFFFHFIAQITKLDSSVEKENDNDIFILDRWQIKYMFVIVGLAYFGYKGYSISQQAYFDEGIRLSKTSTINNQFTNGIYTTDDRATIVNSVLTELAKHVQKDDYLFVYDCSPMLHFLTETKPYTYNPWVWIYDHVSFEEKIKTAESEIETVPIIVQQKFTTISEFSEPMDDYLAENKDYSNTYNPLRAKAMNDFIERHEYKIIWSNDYFNIYKANKNIDIQ